jgi:hypothetical protein
MYVSVPIPTNDRSAPLFPDDSSSAYNYRNK